MSGARAGAGGSLAPWFLVAAAFAIPVLPRLVTHGLFMDGLWYAVVARNQAIGVGTFWRPMLTPTLSPVFFADHPPLVFALESWFFRALGDHWWVAGVYGLAMAGASMALIVGLWRDVERRLGAPRATAPRWLPLLYWVATPLVGWSFSNNMLENTMGVFILAAAWCSFRAFGSRTGATALAWCAAAAGALFGALLCKGFVGLFPLAFPLLLAVALRPRGLGRGLAQAALVLALLLALVALTFQRPDARLFAQRYLEGNFLRVMAGHVQGGVSNRLHIVGKLFLELAPALVLAALLAWAGRLRPDAARARMASAFALLGLAGSLPIMVSRIQSGFYLVPTFAFFAVALALATRPAADAVLAWLAERRAWRVGLAVATGLVLATALGYTATRAGKVGRGGPIIDDVRTIGALVPAGSTLALCPELAREWSLHGYFALYDHVALDPGPAAHPYAITIDGACAPPGGFVRVAAPTRRVLLYRRDVGAPAPDSSASGRRQSSE